MLFCRIFDWDFFDFFNVLVWEFKINSSVCYLYSELGYFFIDEQRYFLYNRFKFGILNFFQDCRSFDIDLNMGFE